MHTRLRHKHGLDKYMRGYLMARIPDDQIERMKQEVSLQRLAALPHCRNKGHP